MLGIESSHHTISVASIKGAANWGFLRVRLIYEQIVGMTNRDCLAVSLCRHGSGGDTMKSTRCTYFLLLCFQIC